MNETLYNLMDWARIEAIVYSEEDNPHEFLGAHATEDGILVQTFMPTAEKMTVKLTKTEKEYPMELVDETGFFAVLLPRKTVPDYTYIVQYDNGTVMEVVDPYNFRSMITEKDEKRFNAGIHYEIYDKLGAHKMTIGGVSGVYFAVWAPNALRVSVVGDFNLWDGRRNPMRRLPLSGIHEVFIPGIDVGEIYKFEIKRKDGLPFLKADPYANAAELRPDTASVVTDLETYKWKDSKWLQKRRTSNVEKEPMSVYEVHLGSWKLPEDGRSFYNYRELAPMIAEYVKEMGYTHIELMPVMEHPFDASWGYQVTGYYAPTSRYGTPEDFMYFVDYMHGKDIGVILDWVPAHFPRDTFGLAAFDGTCLYEHEDPRKGSHPHWGTLIYNYGRPQVSNFLLANALFWVEKFHADGIRMDAVASMLYLDYGKNDGEWVANMYGGNENLEAIDFLKHLNSIFKKQKNGALVIAEESTAWPKITGDLKEDGLGFDLKWNMGYMNDVLGYMAYDPYFRAHHHGELIFSMIYAYSENFMLVFSHDEVVHGKGSMVAKMPGERDQKFANLKALYGYTFAHPGKKLLFMGQDIAQFSEWSEEKGVEWGLLEYEDHQHMRNYVKGLNQLYRNYPALYVKDYDEKGFEWINNISANENIVVFARHSGKKEETLVIVCNFSAVAYQNYKIGVPYAGKYKEVFNSDKKEYGGKGVVNSRLIQSKKDECDDRPNSIRIKVPELGITVFEYRKDVAKVTDNKTAKKTAGKPVPAKNVKDDIKKQMAAAEGEAKPEKTPVSKVTAESVKKAAAKTEPAKKAAEPVKKAAAKTEPAKKAAEPVKKAAAKTEPAKKAAEPVKKAAAKTEPAKKTAEPVKKQRNKKK